MLGTDSATLLAQQQSPKTKEVDSLSEMRRLSQSDPIKDFNEDKNRNDIHFVAIKGITLLVPGVGTGYESYGVAVRVVPGSSDAPNTTEALELTKKVILYAEKYNQLVLALLAQKEKK